MLFNSIDFAIFLPIVFILYWFVTNKNLKLQNLLILIASYIFYGWWDYRFLTLIFFSSVVDYSIGRSLKNEENQFKRKALLWASILCNLGLLGFFKYYNFFLDNFITAFSFFGTGITANSLTIILPVGISFYTFQTLSYTIDIYKKKLEPTNDFIAFSAFVSFFPQLVAGPIERASNLLPQFYLKRTFNYSLAVDGMRQILWGLFKKIVIADNCAEYAEQNDITLLFYTSPCYITYRSNINRAQMNITTNTMDSIATRHKSTYYLNFFSNKDFTKVDFRDADHLNKNGAIVLSELINEQIKKINQERTID